MLAPAHPDKTDPAYRDKKEQHRKDRDDLRRHPERWGFVNGDSATETMDPARDQKE